MKILGVLFFVALFLNEKLPAQILPEGYILQYQQNFVQPKMPEEFRFSNPGLFNIKLEKGSGFLRMSPTPKTDSFIVQQNDMFLIGHKIFGDFILEANVMNESGENEPCLQFYFGIKDSLNYYCLKISPHTLHRDTILVAVLKGRQNKISTSGKHPIAWLPGKWYKIRIERDIVTTTLKVYFDNMKSPSIEMTDRTFIMGYVGFGPGLTTSGIRNIKIWSQTSIPEPARFFSR